MRDALNRMALPPTSPGAESYQHRGTRSPASCKPMGSTSSHAGASTPSSARLRPLQQDVLQTLALWRERSQSRHDLARLMPGMRLELLAQGLDADSEARKPFWRA